MTAVVQINNLDFAYQRGPLVLQNVALQVIEGDFWGVVGPNGGGKTTLIKMILGLLSPNRGSIEVFGKSPTSARSLTGYVPQFAGFDREFPITVEQMALLGFVSGYEAKWKYSIEERLEVRRNLELLEIADLAHTTLDDLSGGQLQRALIARALVTKPRLLILDEPTASIDARGEHTVFEILKRINATTTVIVISHDYSFVSKYINKVACVNRDVVSHGVSGFSEADLLKSYGQSQPLHHHHDHFHKH